MVFFVPPSHHAPPSPVAPDWRRAVVGVVLLLIVAGVLTSVLLHLA